MSTLADLLDALRGAPRLPGALCRGQSDLFDAADHDQLIEAVQTCQRCPALTACHEWAVTLRDNHVSGVVAGRKFVWTSPSLRRGMEAVRV